MAAAANVINATDLDFQSVVLERSRTIPVLVDFWAEWCGPCRTLGPLLENLAAAYDGRFLLAKVDVDGSPNIANQFRVEGIPAVYLIVDGAIVDNFVGASPEKEIRAFLDRSLPTEADRMSKRAAELESADPVGAQRLYEQALAEDPQHGPARAGLAALLLDAGEVGRAEELVDAFEKHSRGWERAEQVRFRVAFNKAAAEAGSLETCQTRAAAAPDDLNARMALGQVYAARGQWPNALETLVSIVERDPAFGKQHVRPIMVQIFQVLGTASDLANEYRSRLGRAMY